MDNGGPAFPVKEAQDRHGDPYIYPSEGMTLRDYFAAKGLQGMLASQHQVAFDNPDKAARWSYEFADAMLKARTTE